MAREPFRPDFLFSKIVDVHFGGGLWLCSFVRDSQTISNPASGTLSCAGFAASVFGGIYQAFGAGGFNQMPLFTQEVLSANTIGMSVDIPDPFFPGVANGNHYGLQMLNMEKAPSFLGPTIGHPGTLIVSGGILALPAESYVFLTTTELLLGSPASARNSFNLPQLGASISVNAYFVGADPTTVPFTVTVNTPIATSTLVGN